MKISKLILISAIVLLCLPRSQAQIDPNANGYFNEALLFSQTTFGGGARIAGVGGAQVSLGGVINSALSNPAGLGMYNRSVFSISPSLNFINSDSEFLNENTTDDRLRFSIPNLGVVFNKTKSDVSQGAFRGGSFGISVSKINDFNNQYTYSANNPQGSDFFTFVFDQIDNTQQTFYEDLAFNAFLLDEFFEVGPAGDTIFFLDYIDAPNALEFPNLQTETVTTSGSQYQWSFSYGGNIADRVFFGASIGLVSVNFNQTRTYTESRSQQSAIGSLTLREDLDVDGSGINATLGVIVRPVNQFQIGFSFVTPTYYNLNDQFEASIESNFNNFFYAPENRVLTNEIGRSDIFLSDYSLTTPLRLNLGATFFLGKYGFISGDIERINYSNSSLRSDDFLTEGDNNTIDNLYQSTYNYRLGMELRKGMGRLRLGYNLQGDPFADDSGLDRSRTNLSAGLGLRTKDYYIDLAVVNSQFNAETSPYTLTDGTQPFATIENSNTLGILTVGVNF